MCLFLWVTQAQQVIHWNWLLCNVTPPVKAS